jgi:hypothetical protein
MDVKGPVRDDNDARMINDTQVSEKEILHRIWRRTGDPEI